MEYKKTLLIILIILTGFTSVAAQSRRGKASYYSKRATGARAASGERIHHDSLTCAHRSYPFGTKLKVKNLSNGKEVIVRVTDRGPFGRGRIVDLSYGAAMKLGMLAQGIAMVEIEKVTPKPPFRMDSDQRDMADIEFSVEDMGTGVAFNYSDLLPHKKRKHNKRSGRKLMASGKHQRIHAKHPMHTAHLATMVLKKSALPISAKITKRNKL